MKYLLLFSLLLSCIIMHAQRNYANAAIDILHYDFNLQLNDENDIIKAQATILVKFIRDTTSVDLDLVKKNNTGKGMMVTAVMQNNNSVGFLQDDEILHINTMAKAGDTISYTISYEGIPADGLIIDKNKYGHRTFFGDNWPNRAHNWLPCIDDPSDKGSVDFIITAPEHYQVISNGLQTEENNLADHLKQTHWKETVNLPNKVMVIGVADFAVNYAADVECIPVYSWVYPEDKDKGFYDYALAKDILPFFIKNVGAYAYKKLANVQSKTQFGGMENASAIFYYENSVQGDRKVEALLTHEIAHQWFGNSATEKSWQHIWLSEGFATYMTHLYLENKYGPDTLQQRMREDRTRVIAFSKQRHTPVVDASVTSNFKILLNANSYQKGGWILHMLRRKLGDNLFWKGIKNYYAQYAGKNATTDDFRKAMETATGKDLQTFFKQWLYTPGQPALNISWKYDSVKKLIVITTEQTQTTLFQFPLQIAVQSANGKKNYTVDIKEKITIINFPAATKPTDIITDPNTNLLFEEVLK